MVRRVHGDPDISSFSSERSDSEGPSPHAVGCKCWPCRRASGKVMRFGFMSGDGFTHDKRQAAISLRGSEVGPPDQNKDKVAIGQSVAVPAEAASSEDLRPLHEQTAGATEPVGADDCTKEHHPDSRSVFPSPESALAFLRDAIDSDYVVEAASASKTEVEKTTSVSKAD